MKLIRLVTLAFTLCIPVAAIASPSVRQATCCGDGSCCPGCPFCPSGWHHS